MDLLLTTEQVAEILGLSSKTVQGLRCRGGGPPWVSVGGRSVRYELDAVQRYVAERRREHAA